MIRQKLFFYLAIAIFLSSCIGNDVIDDRVDTVLRIMNPIDTIQEGSTYTFETMFLNEVGKEEAVDISWLSDDESIITVTDEGVVNALTIGTTTLSAIAIDRDASIEFPITVGENTVVTEVESKNGTLEASSFYELVGDFVITQEQDDLRISFGTEYRASTALPGLYLYLTNNPATINGALEIGKVTDFQGAHEYLVTGQDINAFSHLLYFCKPFNVKVGDGIIND